MGTKKGFQSVEEGAIHTGTESWNIAQYYTGYSIAIPLRDLNDLEDIARFGTVKLDEDLLMPDDQFTKRRADAVKRYWQKLKQIVADTLFKIKKNDRNKAKDIHEWLLEIPKYFDALIKIKFDNVSHDDKLEINEDFLKKLIDELVNKKQEYLYILNNAGLIFREVDEVDLDKMTQDFIHGG